MNNVLLVGRLVREPEVIETEKGNKRTIVTIAVGRSYKNFNGEYETDFIGIKGRIESRKYENENNETKFIMEIIAEKVTFLSSKKLEEESQKKK